MKKKKTWIWLVLVLVVGLSGLGVYQFLNSQDKESTLTILEKQWIENNRNKVIDMAALNNVPILNYEGEGVFLEFLDDLEKATSLEFNKVAYNLEDTKTSDYAFKIVDAASKEDILLYEDYYVFLTKEEKLYHRPEDIPQNTVGVLKDDLAKVSNYLPNKNLAFKSYDDLDKLLKGLEDKEVTALVLPRILYLKEIIDADLNIAYSLTDSTLDYVISLGDNDRLNTILKKYYNKWSKENFELAFAKNLTDDYFSFAKIDEKDKASFRSKQYVYGFVKNTPYDTLMVNSLAGLNYSFMKSFADVADIEITYKEYSNNSLLIDALKTGKIDFYFDSLVNTNFDMDVYKTVSPYLEEVMVLSRLDNDQMINSFASLANKTVKTVKDSKISAYLKELGANLKQYNTVEDLVKNRDKDSLIVLDEQTYRYYEHSLLEGYKVDNSFVLDDNYGFISRDISNNKVFNEYFNFYLSFINRKSILNVSYNNLLNVERKPIMIKLTIIFVSAILVMLLIIFSLRKFKTNKGERKINLSKEDKLRYIDMLTSLKNRNYLNDNIEKWDESEVYPQTIIIIDLNNIAYINDNYGHAEGDRIIKQAANILIKNQIANSDIIRTNGNEFLIYLVGYEEKQVVSYLRKLNKEFKDLDHGFGAASGYSIITDAIKTIDDAVNEATLDMKNNKEEANN